MDTSRSSTARVIRATAAGSSTVCAAACSDSPVAKSRWMTSSWRSRAIRSRSSSRPARAGLLVQAGVLDRQAGGGGQPDGELLVDVGEHLTVGLVGQVQVAVDDAAQPDRHAEERRHRRVSRREPEAVGVGVEVRQPQRFRIEDQQPEDAVTLGTSSDARRLLVAEPDGDELGEPGAGLVEHAQRCVPGIDEIRPGLGDPSQRVGEGLLGPDRHHCVEQPEQLLRTGELETVGHRRGYDPAPLRSG